MEYPILLQLNGSNLTLQVRVDEETVMTAKQIRELQKKNALLEEENLILKKAIAIFTPHSDKD